LTRRATAVAVGALTHALGVAAFFYPFFVRPPAVSNETFAHATDAPVVFSIFAALLIAIAVSEVRTGRMDAKQVALLGVLSGVNAVLRIPGALGGASLMFLLPILCGYAFGARFGFLLGASSMAASAAITGGVGPWLPFEMFALGWVGAGAGLLRRPLQNVKAPWVPLVALAAYGWITGLAYGGLVDLWFWPFQTGAAAISWVPGLGVAETLRRYWRFYVLTSLAWDSARSIANAALVLALGRPLLRLLLRFRARLVVSWRPVNPAPAGASTMEP
jgi:energy-coupling factor transport system substrate-specific component